ncbi:Fungal Zn(2)-Cys(6) binuclear cluster domain-containing protein [Penicillium ucsense]|uniref:Fungal Zn(2)-Cys(6) binuclear cluster domain-containing protein n=1 Tax=Penicillium ucsense TaxID=2839758 RepID=A0A8J8WHN6_9EURO|nr:Fungal Zn(2)-Cys(6) binuclear cluster domain-containing protein [Penicillium ucsense]KAF7731133.1 Fungal Zn(2)-Cys(6) binuclear cluster domain-containing protein [Penicillium ucsense]
MQGYSFAPPAGPPRDGQKNYVFVDEHNRHKRLKVMRACNGCRKRKIKCDAATTNTWPCSACTRLKLVCVPPTIGQDGEFINEGMDSAPEPNVSSATSETSQHTFPVPPSYSHTSQPSLGGMSSYDGMSVYSSYVPPPSTQAGLYNDMRQPPMVMPHQSYQPQSQVYSAQPPQAHLTTTPERVIYDNEQSTADNLSEVLGELKIDETGIAPYIRRQRKDRTEPDAPVQDEVEERLPPLSTGAGATIRIPPELMPDDEDVMTYFKIYFDDIHPYIPVVPRAHLYYQWQNDRNSISPLLLEALFACAGRLSDEPSEGAQWLAMANRHESSFMDVPRLSTIQAMLLLLKARESLPKKGYYYRSWQTVKTIVSMAKDLDIHEHYSNHSEGRPCDLSPIECLVSTRVWQAILVVEVMIGAPQGRSDYGVDPETVDMRPTLDIRGLDHYETERSRQFAYFVRNANHIRMMTDTYHKIKKQKDWGADPRFVQKNPLFADWLRTLPPDLQVNYPEDGAPPWLPSHFVGNMHSHCHLAIILLHRPQLVASQSFTAGGEWKTHFSLCYSSAKNICRLQEAILERFGLSGLLYMQRGINFAIYCILTCTMLHLIAITSPDPQFNFDAREYFTRHMRILERCSTAWPMPEIQAQIDSLRLAFSADTHRPFELKPSFPYGSPSEPYQPSPVMDTHYHPQLGQMSSNVSTRVGFHAHPITPPISAGAESDAKSDTSSQLQSLGMVPHQPPATHSLESPLVDENTWDPTRIINQWDMAFSVNPSTVSTNSPPMPISNPAQPISNMVHHQQYPIHYEQAPKATAPQSQSVSPPQFQAPPVVFSARDWQQSVASVYDPQGMKRRWNYSSEVGESMIKRQR